jgi:hypothetical protein
MTYKAEEEVERIAGNGNGRATNSGFAGPIERNMLGSLYTRVTLWLQNQPSLLVGGVPDRPGTNDAADKIIFGAGDLHRCLTITYDANYVQHLARNNVYVWQTTLQLRPPPRYTGQ